MKNKIINRVFTFLERVRFLLFPSPPQEKDMEFVTLKAERDAYKKQVEAYEKQMEEIKKKLNKYI